MQHGDNVSRRDFLRQISAGAVVAGISNSGIAGDSGPGGWTPPPVLNNPNILVIMVDQMRLPVWLDPSQEAGLSQELPNIAGRIQATAYNFGQYFAAANNCTPARATLLTGLYAPQTAMYITSTATGASTVPALNPAYPTWGDALPLLNPAYRGGMWWFGKWHLSGNRTAKPLSRYGFHTRTYPGGPESPYNPSPDGTPNEGTDGGPFNNVVWASDADIASDFVGWMQGQTASPWCATVSLINPHDINYAPAWLQAGVYPPPGFPPKPVWFPPPSDSAKPPVFYSALPSPWNYEEILEVPNKPGMQYAMFKSTNQRSGPVNDWILFLNEYFWLQKHVDEQIGAVLSALYESPFAGNTVIVFLSDHGEYAGSHGLHTKGFAAYDEGIRVPLSVQFPGQTGPAAMNQMCCSVDVFGLICDLATGGGSQWRQMYPDLATRQSIWSFLYNNASETRVAPSPVGIPYILHTYDEGEANKSKSHIVCMRTKLDLNAGSIGAKLAFYWNWRNCTTYPNTAPPDPEFYDYNPQTTGNTSELGNDYFSNNATILDTIAKYTQVLGAWGPPGSGLIGGELNPPLVGTGTDGQPLSQALAAAQQAYFDYASGPGTCSSAQRR